MASDTNTINIGQIGCGYWGPNLLRNFHANPNCRIKRLVDASKERREFVERSFSNVETSDSIDSILNDDSIEGVVIATPVSTHFDLAKRCLEAGKHILVEKPMAQSVTEIEALETRANDQGLTAMSGHTFLYNTSVRHIKRLIESGVLGDIYYIHSQRLNMGRIRSDTDALWNFAPHDISIIQYWLDNPQPASIQRSGMDFIQPGIQDVVFLNIQYESNVMAQIHVSWLDPMKTRRTVIVGSEKMAIYDDTSENKITIMDKGIDVMAKLGNRMDYDQLDSTTFLHRSGDILMPKVEFVEPLKLEASHFIDCIRDGVPCLTGIDHTKEVIRILEMASKPTGVANANHAVR